MNKIKLFAMMAFAALTVTSCAVDDNPTSNPTYEEVEFTENFTAGTQERLVTLDGVDASAVVDEPVADWVDVEKWDLEDAESAVVQISVLANTTGKARTTVQTLRTAKTIVKLTIHQDAAILDDPIEEETDQPAYSPAQ